MKNLENRMLITYSVTRQDEGEFKHVYTTDHLEDLVMQMIEIYSNELNNKDNKEPIKHIKEEILELFERLSNLN